MSATFVASNMDHVCRKAYEDFCLEVTQKKGLNDHWEKICRQKLHKIVLGKFGEIRAKILPTKKKFTCSYANAT